MDCEDIFDQASTEAAQVRMKLLHIGYDYKTDPDYYAADRIRQKRRQKYCSSRAEPLARHGRTVVPPPTNGESK